VLHVALLEPEIPPNTGNVSRLCAATGLPLHLIGKLGFRMDDASLRRAGIDYWQYVDLRLHANFADFETALNGSRILCYSAHARRPYTTADYRKGDCLLFGCESAGLPAWLLERQADLTFAIPHLRPEVRSLNLSTSVGIVVYEALRQLHAW
jgi:tRNA (cytidine/uridine-2'-O-)-methyltransferase